MALWKNPGVKRDQDADRSRASYRQVNEEYADEEDDDLAIGHDEEATLQSYELQELAPTSEEVGGDDAADGNGIEHTLGRRQGRRRRRTSASTAASFQLYTPDEEKTIVRKFDRRLVVFVAALYMLSFLDRSNIGNARIAGMDADLQSTPPNSAYYEWALSAFYMSYIGFEWMSLLWRLIPAHIFVTCIVASWGLTASLQAVAVSYPMLIALRTALGVGEAAFTGVPFYLSFFFKRSELAFRTAIFISAAPLATSFASTLAWLILKLGESGPIASWRLLFLIEGFPSVLVAAIAWHVIPDTPESAPYLTPRERKVARLRLRRDRPRPRKRENESSIDAQGRQPSELRSREVLAVLADPVAWLTAIIFFLTNMAYSSLPVFLPTILTAMGHSALSAQALSAPPYLLSFVVVLATASVSDRMQSRAPFVAFHALSSAVGYGILAFARVPAGSWLRYAAVYPAAVGFFNVVVLTIAWSVNNQRGESRQGGGFALLQFVGQCGPLVGTRLYPDRDAPFFREGMAVCAGAMLGVAVLAGVLRWWLGRLNRQLEREEARNVAEDEASDEEELVGSAQRRRPPDEAPFRYIM